MDSGALCPSYTSPGLEDRHLKDLTRLSVTSALVSAVTCRATKSIRGAARSRFPAKKRRARGNKSNHRLQKVLVKTELGCSLTWRGSYLSLRALPRESRGDPEIHSAVERKAKVISFMTSPGLCVSVRANISLEPAAREHRVLDEEETRRRREAPSGERFSKDDAARRGRYTADRRADGRTGAIGGRKRYITEHELPLEKLVMRDASKRHPCRLLPSHREDDRREKSLRRQKEEKDGEQESDSVYLASLVTRTPLSLEGELGV